jgi:outer membrane protein
LIEGVLSVPLYEGGRVYSGVRQAKQTASQSRIQVIGTVRVVRENVSNAWNNLVATRQSLGSVDDQLSAANLALDGVQQEFQVGSRTTVDVLNAQQTVLNAQLSQVTARYDQVVASYQLQSAMGHLTARHLGLGGLYDPTAHYDSVRNKWIGLSAETVE